MSNNEHKGLKWVGTINGTKVTLELNNSGELPKLGETGLLESNAEWAVEARKVGVDNILLACEKTERAGHGWNTEFKQEDGKVLVLASSWGKRDNGTKLEAAFYELCNFLLGAEKGVSKDIKEKIKSTMAPFEAEKKAKEERNKAKVANLAKTLAAMSPAERALLEAFMKQGA